MNRKKDNTGTTLSISEFRDYCRDAAGTKFICDSLEQEPQSVESATVRYRFTFDTVLIVINPNIIMMRDQNNNCIRFDRVKYIKKENTDNPDRSVFSIVCGNFYDDNHDIITTVYQSDTKNS